MIWGKGSGLTGSGPPISATTQIGVLQDGCPPGILPCAARLGPPLHPPGLTQGTLRLPPASRWTCGTEGRLAPVRRPAPFGAAVDLPRRPDCDVSSGHHACRKGQPPDCARWLGDVRWQSNGVARDRSKSPSSGARALEPPGRDTALRQTALYGPAEDRARAAGLTVSARADALGKTVGESGHLQTSATATGPVS